MSAQEEFQNTIPTRLPLEVVDGAAVQRRLRKELSLSSLIELDVPHLTVIVGCFSKVRRSLEFFFLVTFNHRAINEGVSSVSI